MFINSRYPIPVKGLQLHMALQTNQKAHYYVFTQLKLVSLSLQTLDPNDVKAKSKSYTKRIQIAELLIETPLYVNQYTCSTIEYK